MSNVAAVEANNFKSEVLESQKPVLVDFWAAWCGPCMMLGPVLDKVAEKLKDKLKIVKLNVDENQPLAAEYQVMSIPCLVLYKNGKEAGRVVGFMNEGALEEKITSLL